MPHTRHHIAIIGAGPAGLMAAETIAQAGHQVTIHDRMPSPGRKFLMAGRGGLNLTHAEPFETFLTRYSHAEIAEIVRAYPPATLIAWANALGQETFTGSTGRIFPNSMKASPLLRAWLTRLNNLGVTLHTRQTWTGWTQSGALTFAEAPEITPDATILALGGASWPKLGSNGAWTRTLAPLAISPLRPSNVGFAVHWSDIFRTRHAGTPLKRIAITHGATTIRGEAMITEHGIEGGAIYTLSAQLREALTQGPVTIHIDLRPDQDLATLAARLDAPRGGTTLSNHLRRANLPPVAIALIQEARHTGNQSPLSTLVKSFPLTLTAPFSIEKAISTAGGLAWSELTQNLMLKSRPGTFAAGEMLDWEAPTGGYLLQATIASGHHAALGALEWLSTPR